MLAVGVCLMALTWALSLTGCSSSTPVTPEGVTVDLVKVHDQFDNEINPSSVDTTNLPLNCRLLVRSSQTGYGLVLSAADDPAVRARVQFPARPCLGQGFAYGGYHYQCYSAYPYVLWGRVDIVPGTLSFTKDGERSQFWLTPTKAARTAFVSVTPEGYTVGEPRQFFFSGTSTFTLYLTGSGPNISVVVNIFYTFDGGWEISTIPNGGVALIDLTTSIVVGTVYSNGVVFGGGLNQLAATIPAGTIKPCSMYFVVNGVKYFITVYVLGTGGGSTSVTGVTITVPTTTVAPGGTMQCSATVQPPGANQGVVWSCDRGTITATGLYTAPGVPGSDRVIAVSVVNPNISDTQDLTVTCGDNSGGVDVPIS